MRDMVWPWGYGVIRISYNVASNWQRMPKGLLIGAHGHFRAPTNIGNG